MIIWACKYQYLCQISLSTSNDQPSFCLYHRVTVSLCDIEGMLAAGGVTVDDKTDILGKNRKDKRSARRSFRRLSKGQQVTPIKMVTDKLRRYSAVNKVLIPGVERSTQQHVNNRCELSHQPFRYQERQMRKLRSRG